MEGVAAINKIFQDRLGRAQDRKLQAIVLSAEPAITLSNKNIELNWPDLHPVLCATHYFAAWHLDENITALQHGMTALCLSSLLTFKSPTWMMQRCALHHRHPQQ